MGDQTTSNLEATVKELLRERSMSMRQLAERTGIHVAIISKMIAGKQRVNPEYLQRIAQGLGVPADVLFMAAGFHIGNGPGGSGDLFASDIVRSIAQNLDIKITFTRSEIEAELLKCEGYAKTPEGQQLIMEKFSEKRQQIIGGGPLVDHLDAMYDQFLGADTAWEERVALGGALLYFLSATDAIPDYVFPIGYLDDAIAIQMTLDRITDLRAQKSEVDGHDED